MAELSVGTIPTTVTALLIVALTALLLIYRRRHPYLSRQYAKFRVISKRTVSQNAERPVVFIAFGVSTASLPTGQHVQVRAVIGGEEVERPYTPARFEPPECELLLRVYPDGKMSRYLYSLDVGDYAELRGPIGHIRYGDGGPGTFSRGSKRKFTGVTHVAMLAGGTGITPMLQLCNHVLQTLPVGSDPTQLRLVEANSCVADIMMHDELRAIASNSSEQLHLTFTVSKLSAKERKDSTLRHLVNASLRDANAYGDVLRDAFDGCPADERTMVCLCGPKGFVTAAKAIVTEIGYTQILVW